MRLKRRRFAAPGGSHDRVVRFLARALPATVGALLAIMILTPLSPRGEISFLLDRNKVAVVQDRMRVSSALYRGLDDEGRSFSISAGSAVQKSVAVSEVELDHLSARILLDDGPALLVAAGGRYDLTRQRVDVIGPLNFQTSKGYRMVANNVAIDLAAKQLFSKGAVNGLIPAGVFSADSMRANLSERTVALEGNAHLRIVPDRMKKP